MRIFYLAFLALLALPAYGQTQEDLTDLLRRLPKPGTGVTIVPASKAICKNDDFFHEQSPPKKYTFSRSTYPQTLLKMADKKVFMQEYTMSDYYALNSDPYDTHLKKSLSQISLAFPFKRLKSISDDIVLGFAVGGGWIKSAGWTDIAEYFNHQELGVCNYLLHDMQLSRSAVWISEGSATYEVNKKVTTHFIEGSDETAFLYTLQWFDDEYGHTLECAKNNYQDLQIKKMIAFARIIDDEVSLFQQKITPLQKLQKKKIIDQLKASEDAFEEKVRLYRQKKMSAR